MRQLLKITTTFALALVFTAGTAFGQQIQQVAEEEIEGDDNNSQITQSQLANNPVGNQAFTKFVGDDNFNRINQTQGDANADYDVFDGSDDNVLRLNQADDTYMDLNFEDADGNRLSSYEDRDGFASQNGDNEQSVAEYTVRNSDGNEHGLFQRGDSRSTVRLVDGANNNDADILQRNNGSGNAAENEAEVRVNSGDYNDVNINQGIQNPAADRMEVEGTFADVNILGAASDFNTVDIDQTKDFDRAVVDINGSSNKSVICQTSGSGPACQ